MMVSRLLLGQNFKDKNDVELMELLKEEDDSLSSSKEKHIFAKLDFSLIVSFSYKNLDAKCAIVFHLLQALLPAVRQKALPSSSSDMCYKGRQKVFGTKESRDAFIVYCATEIAYKEHYNEKVKRESSVTPYISIIGSLTEPKQIMIDFENITYTVFTLEKAIDICFKAYYLFELEYPPACRHMWQFINKQFYGLKDSIINPATTMLLKSIRGKFQ